MRAGVRFIVVKIFQQAWSHGLIGQALAGFPDMDAVPTMG
jgi:hypothetical protein